MKDNKKLSLDDFVAYLPQHNYIYLPTREPWPGESVNSQFPGGIPVLDENGNPVLHKEGKQKGQPVMVSTASWLDSKRPVSQMTWAPGMPMLIEDKLVADGGWIEEPGAVCLNLYRPPRLKGKRASVKPWLDHLKKIYPDDYQHIVKWLAHRLQHPGDKINHAIVLGGAQGIGKDTILEPVKHGVGPWNFAEISPSQMMGTFNGFLKSVVLRISEARNLGESNRFTAYDQSKTYTAAPPDTLRCNEKHLREHSVFNVCGVVITTNYKTDGIYLPADDRRHLVAWSDVKKEDFDKKYWKKLWGWYNKGGIEAVVAYLNSLDISAFDFKAPPPQTPAFWAIVDANRAPEEGELADALDLLGNPDAVTLENIENNVGLDFGTWLKDRKNRRAIPHRMERVNYVPVRNPDTPGNDGLWRIAGKRQTVYAKKTLTPREQIEATRRLQYESNKPLKENEVRENGKVIDMTPMRKRNAARRY